MGKYILLQFDKAELKPFDIDPYFTTSIWIDLLEILNISYCVESSLRSTIENHGSASNDKSRLRGLNSGRFRGGSSESNGSNELTMDTKLCNMSGFYANSPSLVFGSCCNPQCTEFPCTFFWPETITKKGHYRKCDNCGCDESNHVLLYMETKEGKVLDCRHHPSTKRNELLPRDLYSDASFDKAARDWSSPLGLTRRQMHHLGLQPTPKSELLRGMGTSSQSTNEKRDLDEFIPLADCKKACLVDLTKK